LQNDKFTTTLSGEDKGCSKLTNAQALEIFNMKLSQLKIAKLFNVSQVTISRIKRGESYREATSISAKNN
jgi:DNA invertase Pin-like site-specific DNA recombinase